MNDTATNATAAASTTATWYASQIQPFFAPPAWVFGPVWTVLYVIIAASFGYVLVQVLKKKWAGGVFLPFGLNLLFNLMFTPIQFGLKNNWRW
jgi:tryptophan-rich sensory protein